MSGEKWSKNVPCDYQKIKNLFKALKGKTKISCCQYGHKKFVMRPIFGYLILRIRHGSLISLRSALDKLQVQEKVNLELSTSLEKNMTANLRNGLMKVNSEETSSPSNRSNDKKTHKVQIEKSKLAQILG